MRALSVILAAPEIAVAAGGMAIGLSVATCDLSDPWEAIRRAYLRGALVAVSVWAIQAIFAPTGA